MSRFVGKWLAIILMGEGFNFKQGVTAFFGGEVYHSPFDTLKISTSTYDMKLKLYR